MLYENAYYRVTHRDCSSGPLITVADPLVADEFRRADSDITAEDFRKVYKKNDECDMQVAKKRKRIAECKEKANKEHTLWPNCS